MALEFKKKDIAHIRSETAMADMETAYIVSTVLGQGAFGVVNLVIHKASKEPFACKMIKKRIGSTAAYEQQEREVNILKSLCHPNILQLHEVYETSKTVAMILELCDGGEMGQIMRDVGFCTDVNIRCITTQLVDAVTYLHRNRIIHRDIKPENILLKSKDKNSIQIKIADFGLACHADGEHGISNMVGTPLYMAPEIIQKLGYNHSCDIWSIGIMLYLFLCGYDKKAEAVLHEMVQSGKIEYPVDLWQKIDVRAKKLCELILRIDPAKRISAGEIQSHPWILNNNSASAKENTGNNVLDLMRSYNAERRLKKAIIFVTAAVRFLKGAKMAVLINNSALELNDALSTMNVSKGRLSVNGGKDSRTRVVRSLSTLSKDMSPADKLDLEALAILADEDSVRSIQSDCDGSKSKLYPLSKKPAANSKSGLSKEISDENSAKSIQNDSSGSRRQSLKPPEKSATSSKSRLSKEISGADKQALEVVFSLLVADEDSAKSKQADSSGSRRHSLGHSLKSPEKSSVASRSNSFSRKK